jgi:acetyltransferase (GNAT) family protein
LISDEIRRFAEDPSSVGPVPPPESGLERVLTDRYCIFLGPTFTNVQRLRLAEHEADEVIAEIRAIVAERKRWPRVDWWIGSSATPPDLVERLLALGLTREHGVTVAMACLEAPPGASGVVARGVETFEEYVTAHEIAYEAFEAPEEDREAWRAIAVERWQAEQADPSALSYLAWVDGEPVGSARGIFLPQGVLCIGGAVLESGRGRGAYRALVRARWDDAVAAATPALVVQAGDMSRPILERSGFVGVAEIVILYDRGG